MAGVTDITAKDKGEKYDVTVKLLFGNGKYTVSNVTSDEKVTVGERKISITDYEALGKYYVKVGLGDTSAADALIKKYSAFEVHEIKGADGNLKLLYTYPSTHDIAIYIGSDVPISVEEETGEIDFKTSLKISVNK